MKYILFTTALLFSVCSFADGAVVDALTQVNEKVPAALPMGVLAIVIMLIEMGMRLVPTVKPRSLFITLAKVLGVVGSLCTKVSNILDSIVQNLKPEVTESKDDSKAA